MSEVPSPDSWLDDEEMKWVARAWAARMGVKLARIYLRQTTRKWASISTNGHLTLSSELIEMPRRVGEFVIVHEIVHMLAPNHGRVFKSFLQAYMPDWQDREQELRSYENDRMKEP